AYYAFYRLLRAISEIDIPLDSGDFCVMGRRVVDALNAMPERMRFVRGMRSFVGFRQIGHEYERAGRGAGKPKYTLASLASLAIDGLVSFSNFPLRLVTKLGIVAALSAVILIVATIVDAIARRSAPHGWASTIVVVLAMGAVQLLSLGIFGEYLRLIFLEAKGRPFYIIARTRARNAAAARQSASQPHDHDLDEGDRRRWNGAGDLARTA
ncbi:MAG TPA: hypothetical protein VHV08_03115, partial [Pirellulales bacterium]|nr:hypothetical protein [Pirellulales bacterium]